MGKGGKINGEHDGERRRNLDLHSGGPFRQNYKNVIPGGEGRAPLHSMAGAGSVPGTGPGGVLPREGRLLAGGQADLRGLPGPHRVSELRPPPRRAVRRVGGHERTGATTPEADGVLTFERG